MSSSQVANAATLPAGYAFSSVVIRDTSDWIRRTRESREYLTFSGSDNKVSTPPWLPNSVNFRLSFANGRWKCTNCTSNAFGGSTGPLVTAQ